jgi:hypothetical protein
MIRRWLAAFTLYLASLRIRYSRTKDVPPARLIMRKD